MFPKIRQRNDKVYAVEIFEAARNLRKRKRVLNIWLPCALMLDWLCEARLAAVCASAPAGAAFWHTRLAVSNWLSRGARHRFGTWRNIVRLRTRVAKHRPPHNVAASIWYPNVIHFLLSCRRSLHCAPEPLCFDNICCTRWESSARGRT